MTERNDLLEKQLSDELVIAYESVKTDDKTLEQLQWFNAQPSSYLDALMHNPAKVLLPLTQSILNKFELYGDYGTVIVPPDFYTNSYYHQYTKNWIDEMAKNRKVDFKEKPYEPNTIVKPGDELYVSFFRQKVPGTTTTEERLLFLMMQDSILLGIEGLSLLYKQLHDSVETDCEYVSYSEKKNSFRDIDNNCCIPSLFYFNAERPGLSYSKFNDLWDEQDIMVCFHEAE